MLKVKAEEVRLSQRTLREDFALPADVRPSCCAWPVAQRLHLFGRREVDAEEAYQRAQVQLASARRLQPPQPQQARAASNERGGAGRGGTRTRHRQHRSASADPAMGQAPTRRHALPLAPPPQPSPMPQHPSLGGQRPSPMPQLQPNNLPPQQSPLQPLLRPYGQQQQQQRQGPSPPQHHQPPRAQTAAQPGAVPLHGRFNKSVQDRSTAPATWQCALCNQQHAVSYCCSCHGHVMPTLEGQLERFNCTACGEYDVGFV
ncbi:hypothetical protein HYH03_015390 [Edaphochlamys debaryana]|uniref:Uncharacterized protein n=1 Tax=Edaphochlamys debaryana TaxID=47281 RepID=A0A835XPJ2_9CHLO|nr:hypothetical protein HYH03_015390 [Edaphochlamys debaryana]|eukprot:KAG2485946.1 hypothetical protein HYH03_015390 [Edaphochlamys debaryana]